MMTVKRIILLLHHLLLLLSLLAWQTTFSCDTLLEKIDKSKNNPPALDPNRMNSDLDILKKLQTQIS